MLKGLRPFKLSLIICLLLLPSLASAQEYKSTFGGQELTIGSKQGFSPEFQLNPWGEDSLRFKLNETGFTSSSVLNSKITSVSGNKQIEIFKAKDGLKFLITFNSKPLTNTYSFDVIGYEDFRFDYQTPFPSPTEYIQDGEVWLLQDKIPGDPAVNHRRLKKIDGGYVISHKIKEHNRYKTGFVGAIFVPLATDKLGKEAWCSLNYKQGAYTVTIPQNFLDTATYPVVINDQVGETSTAGMSAAAFFDKWIIGDWITLHSTGTVQSFFQYCEYFSGTTNEATFGIYDDSDPNGNPIANGVAGASAMPDTGSGGWLQVDFGTDPTITSGTTYWTALHAGCTYQFWYVATGDANRGLYDNDVAYSSGNLPTNLNWDDTDYDRKVAVYLDYTPAGGGGVIKTYNGLAWASVKTIDGLAVASVKTINGAAAQ